MSFNSREYQWSDLTVVIGGKSLVRFTALKYGKKTEKTRLFARGKKAHAIQTGNEEVEGEITFLQSELIALRAAARALDPKNDVGDIAFDIIVQYQNDTKIETRTILGAEIEEYEEGLTQGDPNMEIPLKFIALDVV